jgi:hypothetical protein
MVEYSTTHEIVAVHSVQIMAVLLLETQTISISGRSAAGCKVAGALGLTLFFEYSVNGTSRFSRNNRRTDPDLVKSRAG